MPFPENVPGPHCVTDESELDSELCVMMVDPDVVIDALSGSSVESKVRYDSDRVGEDCDMTKRSFADPKRSPYFGDKVLDDCVFVVVDDV